MNNMLEQLFLPYTSQLGMQQTEADPYRKIGSTYHCITEIGAGFCWVYSYEDLFSLSVYDFKIQEPVTPKYDHPEFFTIGRFNAPTTEYIYGQPKKPQPIISYNRPEGTFCETFPRGTHANSSGLTLSPSFIKLLSKKFCIDYNFLTQSCLDIKDDCIISNADLVLKQMFSYQPPNCCAPMYYEGKIMELITMLIEWQVNKGKYAPDTIRETDLEGLEEVSSYLKKHYHDDISIDALLHVAFMGRNKLSHLFKLKYGVSIMEYLRAIRIEEAKNILLNTSHSVQAVALMVGYRNQGSFSERFKETTGMSPTEFRNQII